VLGHVELCFSRNWDYRARAMNTGLWESSVDGVLSTWRGLLTLMLTILQDKYFEPTDESASAKPAT
jgi:hypothetical protein